MNKYIKLLAVNFCIAGTAVFLYSPGLLCLRLSDESVFRAGMSILAAPALMGAFFFANTAPQSSLTGSVNASGAYPTF